jgi:hypothetical protein
LPKAEEISSESATFVMTEMRARVYDPDGGTDVGPGSFDEGRTTVATPRSGRLMGRPPLPPGRARTGKIESRLRPATRAALAALAARRGLPASALVAGLIEQELAREGLTDA